MSIYLEDFSTIDCIESSNLDYNPNICLRVEHKNAEPVVVFNISIPIADDIVTIDLIINNELYQQIGRHFKPL